MNERTTSDTDGLDNWLVSPRQAFMAWLLSDDFARLKSGKRRPMQESSISVYRAMFFKFVRQVLEAEMGGGALRIIDVSTDDIQRFLDHNQLKAGIRDRYIRLLSRTYEHLALLGMKQNNPAEGLVRSGSKPPSSEYDPPTWLSAEEQDAVVTSLPGGDDLKSCHNRALLAVLIGGGLRASEILYLRVQDIGPRQGDGSVLLKVPPAGAGRAHETLLNVFAANQLEAWVERLERYRFENHLTGELLFPSTETWVDRLSPTTVYRLVSRLFAAAGIPQERIKRRGSRTLRNTFAIAQLDAGAKPERLGEYLGHRTDNSTRYYIDARRQVRKSD